MLCATELNWLHKEPLRNIRAAGDGIDLPFLFIGSAAPFLADLDGALGR